MTSSAAAEQMAGRPRKYGSERTEPLSVRLPESVLRYLGTSNAERRSAVLETLFFEKELTEFLADYLTDLRISAANGGQSYELDRAEVLARLILLGLSAEKKPRK